MFRSLILSTLLSLSSAEGLAEVARRNPHATFKHYVGWAGLSDEEFRRRVGKAEPLKFEERPQFDPPLGLATQINETIDWQQAGAVTAVKDQHLDHMYGTCWSFATSGTMEGQELTSSGRTPVDLSPQMLIDCCPQCGGHPDVSLNWLLAVGGQDTQESYGPYQGKKGTCNNMSATVGQRISSVHALAEGEDQLMAMLQHGPMHVAIDCTSLKSYSSGIATDTTCADAGNHDVLLIGAGESEDGIKYWRLKNSWGDWWGEAGFFRVERGTNQLCIGKKNRWGSAATSVTGIPTLTAAVV